MIRINLISEGRRPVVARKARPKLAIGDQDPSLFFLAGGLVLGLLIAGGLVLYYNAQLAAAKAKVAEQKAEMKKLRPILKEVKQFKKKQKRLETKIDVINKLNARRKGPVRVMDEVSRALPDLVWLQSMSIRGRRVTLNGKGMNTNAIAAFIENLGAVPGFREPDTKNVRRGGGRTFSFSISFRYQNIEPPKPTDTETAAGEGEAGDAPAEATAAAAAG